MINRLAILSILLFAGNIFFATSYSQIKKSYEFDFKEDIKNIDLTEPVIALWLFRERADRGSSPDINLAGKPIKYAHNTFIITKSKDIKIIEKSKIYIRRPFVQFKMSVAEFDKIVERLK